MVMHTCKHHMHTDTCSNNTCTMKHPLEQYHVNAKVVDYFTDHAGMWVCSGLTVVAGYDVMSAYLVQSHHEQYLTNYEIYDADI